MVDERFSAQSNLFNFFADVKNFCEDNFPDILNFVNLLNLEPNLLKPLTFVRGPIF